MFFEKGTAKRLFIINDIEWLFVTAEITLKTHYRERFQRHSDHELENEFMLIDLFEDDSGIVLERVYRFLLNMRVLAAILANLLWNHIKILIRQRVNYDKDLFNFEEYRQKGLNDGRLIKNMLFMISSKGCKNLVAEYFRFHKES